MQTNNLMQHTVKIVSIMVLLAIGTITGGQTADPEGYPVRFSYQGSPELPDGIAFRLTLISLNHEVENGNLQDAVWWMAKELKLPTDQAEAFVNQAVATLQNIDADIKKANANLACKDGIPIAYNEDVYAVLQEMYGIEIAVANQHYEELKASLDADTAVLLQKFIDKRKLNIVYKEIDFAKAAEKSGRFDGAALSSYCE